MTLKSCFDLDKNLTIQHTHTSVLYCNSLLAVRYHIYTEQQHPLQTNKTVNTMQILRIPQSSLVIKGFFLQIQLWLVNSGSKTKILFEVETHTKLKITTTLNLNLTWPWHILRAEIMFSSLQCLVEKVETAYCIHNVSVSGNLFTHTT